MNCITINCHSQLKVFIASIYYSLQHVSASLAIQRQR